MIIEGPYLIRVQLWHASMKAEPRYVLLQSVHASEKEMRFEVGRESKRQSRRTLPAVARVVQGAALANGLVAHQLSPRRHGDQWVRLGEECEVKVAQRRHDSPRRVH